MDKEAAEADEIFAKHKKAKEQEIQSLLQEQSVLEATIDKIKKTQYVDQPKSLVQQELNEAKSQLQQNK